MPDTNQTNLNHRLTLRIIEMAWLTLVFSLLARPLISELHPYYLWIGIFDIVLVGIVYLLVRGKVKPEWNIAICLIVAVLIILPMLLVSGGVNSQVAFFIPIYPIVGALIGGKTESLLMSVFLVICIILGTVFHDQILTVSGEFYSQETSYLRGFWLSIATVFSAIFGQFFIHRYAKLTKKLRDENLQDPLTEILNRRGLNLHFSNELEQAQRTKSDFSLMLIDIDFFKSINDKYGHDVGDSCLIEMAELLGKNINNGHFLARFGGEEFIIILPHTGLDAAQHIAEQLRQAIENHKFSEFNLSLTITLGLASLHKENDNALKLIKRADKALYKGKNNGRNRVEVEEDSRTRYR